MYIVYRLGKYTSAHVTDKEELSRKYIFNSTN